MKENQERAVTIITVRNIFRDIKPWNCGEDDREILPVIWMAKQDVSSLSLRDGEIVQLRNGMGHVLAILKSSETVPDGYAFMVNGVYANRLVGYSSGTRTLPNFKSIEAICEPTDMEGQFRPEIDVHIDESGQKIKKDRLNPLQIYQLLPKTNCKKCGCVSCFAFAFALINRQKGVGECPEVASKTIDLLGKYFGSDEEVEEADFMILKKERCIGCGDCVKACANTLNIVVEEGRSFVRGDIKPVIKVVNGKLKVMDLGACKRNLDPPVFCHLCEQTCPFDALELVTRDDASDTRDGASDEDE